MQCIFNCMHKYGHEEEGKEKYLYTYISPPSNSAEHAQRLCITEQIPTTPHKHQFDKL